MTHPAAKLVSFVSDICQDALDRFGRARKDAIIHWHPRGLLSRHRINSLILSHFSQLMSTPMKPFYFFKWTIEKCSRSKIVVNDTRIIVIE